MSSLRALAARVIWRPLRRPCCRYYAVKSYPGGVIKRPVSTLDPSLLEPTDFLDISECATVVIGFPRSDLRQTLLYGKMKEVIPFPTHAHGFLYYYSGPNAGPLEGGVRLRCTSDSSSSSFVRGQDLLGPSRLPWQISLPQVACRATYASLANQLVHENLVTQEQLSRCKSIFSHRDSISPYSTLFHLDSTFLVNFSRKVVLTVVGEALHPLNLTNLFTQYRKRVVICPWTGSAVARFEASTLPQHAGRRVLHLRIVKILQPVACSVAGYEGRVVRPEEGHLFTVRFRGQPPEPWAFDIDRKYDVAAALRVLWDNTRTP